MAHIPAGLPKSPTRNMGEQFAFSTSSNAEYPGFSLGTIKVFLTFPY